MKKFILTTAVIFGSISAQAECFKLTSMFHGITSPSMGNGKGYLILEGSDGKSYGIKESNKDQIRLAELALSANLDYCLAEVQEKCGGWSRGAIDSVVLDAIIKR